MIMRITRLRIMMFVNILQSFLAVKYLRVTTLIRGKHQLKYFGEWGARELFSLIESPDLDPRFRAKNKPILSCYVDIRAKKRIYKTPLPSTWNE